MQAQPLNIINQLEPLAEGLRLAAARPNQELVKHPEFHLLALLLAICPRQPCRAQMEMSNRRRPAINPLFLWRGALNQWRGALSRSPLPLGEAGEIGRA